MCINTWISVGNRDSRKTQAHQHIKPALFLIVPHPLPSIPWNYNQKCQTWMVAGIWGRWGTRLPAIVSCLPLGITWVWLWNSSKWQWKSLLFLAETLSLFLRQQGYCFALSKAGPQEKGWQHQIVCWFHLIIYFLLFAESISLLSRYMVGNWSVSDLWYSFKVGCHSVCWCLLYQPNLQAADLWN